MKFPKFLLLATGVALCSLAPSPALGQNPPREIVTVGHAVLKSKPSILVLEIAVTGAGPTAEDARKRSASKTEALVSDFRRFGIKPDDWERNLSVARRPVPDEPKRIGFWATTTLIARLDDYAAGLEMFDRATIMEVSSVHFRFETSDPQGEYEKALKRALADARFKAEALAAEGNVKLGTLLGCEELSGSEGPVRPPVFPAEADAHGNSGNEPPIHQQVADLKTPAVTTVAEVRARFAIIQ